jgi:hypothetical protein
MAWVRAQASPAEKTRASEAKPAPKLLVTKPEAADRLSMSVDSFERYVMPDLRLVRRGRLVLVPVAELEGWVYQNAAPTLPSAA